MKDLLKLVRECKEELDALGIEYRTVRNWTVNTRSQRRWGQCKVVSSDVFDINISAQLLADQVSDTAAKDTIIHELLHTVEGCLKHTGKWKALAEKVNRAYPQYHIKRATTEEEKGFEKTARTYHKNYKITCTKCGSSVYRQKASKVVLHPEQFKCRICGGKFVVEKQ